jgi:hypothetical protein
MPRAERYGISSLGEIECHDWLKFIQVLFFALWPLSNAIGPWSVTYLLAALSVINCVVAMFIGRHCLTCLAAFICVERWGIGFRCGIPKSAESALFCSILTRCGAHTFYMYFMGDVIDDDYKRNKRQYAIFA